jgi:hypothetical protein
VSSLYIFVFFYLFFFFSSGGPEDDGDDLLQDDISPDQPKSITLTGQAVNDLESLKNVIESSVELLKNWKNVRARSKKSHKEV